MKYQVGDKIRIKTTNEDEEVVHKGSSMYPYKVKIGEREYFFREGELCDPAPIKVGEVVVNENGGEAKILDVFENTFSRSFWNNFDECFEVSSFKEIEQNGWKIKGKESDKTQEAIDLLKSNGYQIIKK